MPGVLTDGFGAAPEDDREPVNAELSRVMTVNDLLEFVTGQPFLDLFGASGVALSVLDQDRRMLATTGRQSACSATPARKTVRVKDKEKPRPHGPACLASPAGKVAPGKWRRSAAALSTGRGAGTDVRDRADRCLLRAGPRASRSALPP
ncbi:hypothetical protein P8A22_03565 [Streptomyces laculatispora]|uniref:Uncharacterized protein n=1 Tax=Streptomyces laculatispora TaxID=887464 RepID=A0ABY9HX90_9ACTN|nr:hypothetical protein [Streptomyces laculatispora]WLQ39185.1 hypothetical protein P8A22_03565 [Streptomyces laculatispora]